MASLGEEQVKKVVIEGYVNILKKWPDKMGMELYTKLLMSGELIQEQFYDILINSEEYKEKFGNSISFLEPILPQKISKNIEDDKQLNVNNDKSVKNDNDKPVKNDNDKHVKNDNDKPVKNDNDKPVKNDNDKHVKNDNDKPVKNDNDKPVKTISTTTTKINKDNKK